MPGLSPENAAAVSRRFERIGQLEKENPQVSDPSAIGVQVSSSNERSRSNSSSTTDGTDHSRTRSSSHTVGGSSTAEGGVDIPFVAEGKVSVTASYSYETGRSDTHSRSHSETTERSRSYSETFGKNLDLDARQKYEASVRSWNHLNAYQKAADDVSDWASDRGKDYKERFRREREEIYR